MHIARRSGTLYPMVLKSKQAVLQKVIFELRYRHGYIYLDKCGRTINALTSRYPEWTPRDDAVSPQNAPLVSLQNRCVLNFSSKKLDLSLEMLPGGEPLSDSDLDAYADQVEATSVLITEQLGLTDFERIGFRAWFLFACESAREATTWLMGLKAFSLSEQFHSAFAGDLDFVSVAVVFRGETNYRVALNQVERAARVEVGQEILNVQASKLPKDQQRVFHEQLRVRKRLDQNPQFAALMDIDAFCDDPPLVAPREFIKKSMLEFTTKAAKMSK